MQDGRKRSTEKNDSAKSAESRHQSRNNRLGVTAYWNSFAAYC